MSVRCTRCNSDNPDGARFCNICGAPIAPALDDSLRTAVAVTCLNCGATNSSALRSCGSCGKDLTASAKAVENRPPPPPHPPARQCPNCGRQIDPAADVCSYCGVNLSTGLPIKHPYVDPKPGYAAILMFGTGALGLFAVGYNLAFEKLPLELEQFEGLRECCGEITMVLAIACVIGGYFAMRRQHFMLAIVGAIAGMMTVGLYVGFIMAFIALILLAISQKEFES